MGSCKLFLKAMLFLFVLWLSDKEKVKVFEGFVKGLGKSELTKPVLKRYDCPELKEGFSSYFDRFATFVRFASSF